MTTELQEPKAPIRVDVLQKQYRNGMTLKQLALLYEVDESVLAPYVEGVELKERKNEKAMLVRQVRELYEQEQLGMHAIGEILGKNRMTIHKIVKENAFKKGPRAKEPERKARSKRARYDYQELSKRIEGLLNAGMLADAIMFDLNISKTTFYAVKKKYGANWNVRKKGRSTVKDK